jgi:hypothetical protein
MIREILSNTVLLQMGSKSEKSKMKTSEILGFTTRNGGIVVTSNKYLPYNRTGNTTPYLCTHLQQTEIFSTHIIEIWRIKMFVNH